MLDGYKWGIGILVGVFCIAYFASAYGWGLTDESAAQAQGLTTSGGGGGSGSTYTGGRSYRRVSVRSFGSGSRWSSSGHSSGK